MKQNGQLRGETDQPGFSEGFNFIESAPGRWVSVWAYSDPYIQRFCVEYRHKRHAPMAEALKMIIEAGRAKQEDEYDRPSAETLAKLSLQAYDAGLSYASPETALIAPIALAEDARHLFEAETLGRLQLFMPPTLNLSRKIRRSTRYDLAQGNPSIP